MKDRTALQMLRIALVLLGLLAALAAVFARPLGLDTNASWGPSRWFLFLVGIGVGAAPFAASIARSFSSLWAPISRRIRRSSIGNRVARLVAGLKRPSLAVARRLRPVQQGFSAGIESAYLAVERIPGLGTVISTARGRAALVAAGVLLLASAFDLWLLTTGFWNRWPSTTSHFSLLAEGFLQGQLHLPLEPSAQLLTAPDPYAMEARQYMPDVWDVSYFQGKFYLYWGPVPSLLLTVPALLLGQPIGDWALVLTLTLATTAVGVLLVLRLWSWSRPSLPWWLTIPGVFLMAFANPLPWLLSRPSVYEAAIICGQFFFLLGLLAALPVLLQRRFSARNVAVSGVAWGMAIGSRVTLAPAVGALSLALVLILIWGPRSQDRRRWWPSPALIVPLLLAIALLGLYNWARFGELLEFGHRYQLGRWNKFDQYESVVAVRNLIPNLYNYFLNPPHLLSLFPFVKPAWGAYYIWPAHYYAPQNYHTERITGILLSAPYIGLAAAAAYQGLKRLLGFQSGNTTVQPWLQRLEGLPGIAVLLTGATLLLLAPISLFVSASMRHMADFAPVMILLATVGFWQAYLAWQRRVNLRRLVVWVAFVLASLSISMGILLAMTGFEGRFERLNPELFNQLSHWLTP